MDEKNRKTVVVGMSGGVDSSVAAFLLKEAGYQVIGVTMQIWQSMEQAILEDEGGCCGLRAVDDARRVADKLDIPYYVLNFKDVFRDKVITYFDREYLRGRTPNPCIACNRYVKWEALLQRAREIGADYIATGHYARIITLPNGRSCVRRSVTAEKDQTYMLYSLSQDELSHTLFPIGDYRKDEVRRIAEEAGLPTAHKHDSQDICFIPGGDYIAYLERELPPEKIPGPGNFVTRDGKVIGRHKGITHYTVGQRRGLSISSKGRLFVTEIRPDTNEVVVGPDAEVYSKKVCFSHLESMEDETLDLSKKYEAKVRYSHKSESCKIIREDPDKGTYAAIFDEPVRAAAPGQALVLYDGDLVAGGGVIEPI